jgi:hypothetical protein|tara:strand:- start:258 stop:470 length:213 start_codon:yes stop_codon:yes gene_type:complete
MKTDINGVPWTYENKDELVFDIEDESTYRGSTRLLDRLKEEKELIEWNIMSNESDLEVLTQKIRSLQYEM